MSGRRIVVTGATGLLGRRLVALLASEGDEVFAVSRSGTEAWPAGVRGIAADLSAPFAGSLYPEHLDGVVYLAQSPQFRSFPEGAGDMHKVNVAQPLALLDHALRGGASHFVYASTGSVYAPSQAPLSEDSPLGGSGFYPASKQAAEQLISPFRSELTVALLRYFFIYGRGQKVDMLIPRLVASVREGRAVKLQGAGGLRFNPVQVDDAARATAAALTLDASAAINVAGPQALSLQEACETIGDLVGREATFEHDEAAQTPSLLANIEIMSALLSSPTFSFREGVRQLI